MPKYTQKITSLMPWAQFLKGAYQTNNTRHRAFLAVLFLSGCRVSEALALTRADLRVDKHTLYISFKRLKGSKQTDPFPLPNLQVLAGIFHEGDRVFPFSYITAYRMVRAAFPAYYPHFFRMNRITKVVDKFGDQAAYDAFGISANAIDHYRGKVSLKRVGDLLEEEVRTQ